MTTLSFPIGRSVAKRRSYRRWVAPAAADSGRQGRGALSREAATDLGRRSVYLLGASSVLVVGLHVAVMVALSRPHVEEIAVERPRIPPIEIEVTRPQPLPQAVVPVPPPPPVVTPQSERRAPVRSPRPTPSKPAEATPVVNPAPQAAPNDQVEAAPTAPVASVPAAPAAPAAPPVIEKVTPPRGEAGYLSNPPPKYPVVAQSRGWEGQVLLNVHVLASGRPDAINVAASSGRKTLDDAAVQAVTEWKFVPAKRGQTPIDGWVQVPIDFKLGK